MNKRYSLPTLACLPLLACGGDSHPKITTPDAKGSGSVDAKAPCTATADYGAVNFGSNQFAETDGSGTTGSNAHFEVWDGVLNQDALFDGLQIELYAAAGGFGSADIKPGTYTISGADAQYASCGICVRIFTDVGSNGMGVDDYLASSGTVTLTTTSGSNFNGSVSNLVFDHVTINSQNFMSTVVGDCQAHVTSGTISTKLTVGSGFQASANSALAGAVLTHRYR